MKYKLFLCIFLCFSTPCYAESALIRDTQIERFLRKIISPIINAADLNSDDIDIYIVNDPSINAFVTGGQNLFLNTGIITLDEDPTGLMGVVAHEVGHISGGHLVRMSIGMQDVQRNVALGYILGIAAAVAGSPDAAQALILGSSHVGERSLYSYSRKHEEAADEAAIKYLEETKISSRGLINFFKKISDKEALFYDSINPYTRSHPLIKSRISHIESETQNSPYFNKKTPKILLEEFAYIRAKLDAFLLDPEKVLKKYRGETAIDRYATVIAKHRMGYSKIALNILEKLIQNSKDPYLIELKGQILFEMGNVDDAVVTYQKANHLIIEAPLIKIQLAAAIVASKNEQLYTKAIQELRYALILDRSNYFAWYNIAKLYGRTKQMALANLALAEGFLLKEDYDKAIKFAKLAKHDKLKDSNITTRASDIIIFAIRKKKG